jgi:hypothetical protein
MSQLSFSLSSAIYNHLDGLAGWIEVSPVPSFCGKGREGKANSQPATAFSSSRRKAVHTKPAGGRDLRSIALHDTWLWALGDSVEAGIGISEARMGWDFHIQQSSFFISRLPILCHGMALHWNLRQLAQGVVPNRQRQPATTTHTSKRCLAASHPLPYSLTHSPSFLPTASSHPSCSQCIL